VGDPVSSFFLALASSLGLTWSARRVGPRLGLVDRPTDELKIHREPVSVLGGVAVVGAVFLTMILLGPMPSGWLVVSVGVVLAGGLVDDVRSLPVWLRVQLQLAAGIALLAGGAGIDPLGPFAGIGVVVLVLACTNAVNLVDGVDGLAGGLGAAAALGLAVLAPGSDVLGFALAGALAGFLVFNLRPGTVFLGNGGAYALGVLLASQATEASRSGWRGLAAAAVCLGVFGFELVLTVVRRARTRDRLAAGDRSHSYDRLARAIGIRPAVVVFWGTGVAAALTGIVVGRSSPAIAAATGSSVAAAGIVAVLLLMRGSPAPRSASPSLERSPS
jgi:UDP-N-acetylmuramyl pentapeptide phosphotransferase/UDP-N-acetylglucosamine-1-phosphate transferase